MQNSTETKAAFGLQEQDPNLSIESSRFDQCVELLCPKCEYSDYKQGNQVQQDPSGSTQPTDPTQMRKTDEMLGETDPNMMAFIAGRLRQSYFRKSSLNVKGLGSKTWSEYQSSPDCKFVEDYYLKEINTSNHL